MADRTVNVNINYRVNTAEVVRAQKITEDAQKATDNLRKSAQTYGTTASQAHKQSADAAKSAQKDVAGLAGEFSNLYSSVKLVLTAGIAKELVSLQLEMAKLSGQVEGVNRAFSRLPNSTLLLNDLRKATHGTVNDLELMQKALSANNFKIPLEKLGTLLEFAAAKAQQTGQEVNHLVDYIVSGIGYRSIKRLDDLGFTANRVKEALGGVSLQAASMGQVMDAVTKLMNEDLQQTGGYAETTATTVGQIETAFHDLGVEVSKQGTSTGFLGFLKEAVNALRVFTKADFDIKKIPAVVILEETTKMAEEQASTFTKTNAALKEQEKLLNTDKKLFQLAETLKLYKDQQASDTERVKTLKEEVAQLEEKNKSLFGLQKLTGETKGLIDDKKREIKSIEASSEALTNNKAVVSEVIRVLVDYRESLKLTDDVIKKETENSERNLPDNLAFMTGKKPDRQKSIVSRNDLVDVAKQIEDALKTIPPVNFEVHPDVTFRPDELQKIGDEFASQWRQIVSQGIGDLTNVIDSSIQNEADGYDRRLQMLQDYYDTQITMAGDNERKKKELAIERDREERKLRKEAFEADKEAKRLQTIINGAAGVINAFATLPYPAAVVASILLAGETAAQLAIISQQQYKGYAKGVIDLKGPGSDTSDSIPARLSRGESVMTAKETRESKGILTAIRHNRLDDRILRNIDFSGGRSVMNDERIVAAIVNQKYPKAPDLIKQGRQIYEVHTDKQNNKRYIRSKSI